MKRLPFISPRQRKKLPKQIIVATSPDGTAVTTTSNNNDNVPLKDLLNILKERVNDVVHSKQDLKSLNEVFLQVTKSMEQQEQDSPASVLKQELKMREKEVQCLVKRCEAERDKIKAATLLKASNTDLQNQIQQLQRELDEQEEDALQVDRIKDELNAANEKHRLAQERINKLKKDHDDVVDTLNKCFLTIQELESGRQGYQEEREEESKRARVELEKQRLEFAKSTAELRTQMQERNQRIEQLEGILRDNMATATALRRERVKLKESLDSLHAMEEEHAHAIAKLTDNQAVELQKQKADFEAQIQELESTLESKNILIETLEQDISVHMEEFMKVSKEVEEMRGEHLLLQDEKESAVHQFEQENLDLQEQLLAKELEIASLTSTVAFLQCDKTDLSDQLAHHHERTDELEVQNMERILDLQQQLEDAKSTVQDVNDNHTQYQQSHAQKMNTLQEELKQQRAVWCEREKDLTESLATLKREKRVMAQTITSQSSVAQDDLSALQDDLERTQQQNTSLLSDKEGLQHQLETEQTTILSLRGELERLRAASVGKETKIQSLRSDIEKLRSASDQLIAEERQNHRKVIETLRAQLEEEQQQFDAKNDEVEKLFAELEEARECARQQVSDAKQQLQQQERMVTTLTQKIGTERQAKIAAVKSIREEGERAKQGWKAELNQANVLLQQKKKQVEGLQLDLITLSSKRENDANSADRSRTVQTKQLDHLQQEVEDQQTELQEKKTELDKLRSDHRQAKLQAEEIESTLTKKATQLQGQLTEMESTVRRERSLSDGKSKALEKMGVDLEAATQQHAASVRTISNLEKEIAALQETRNAELLHRERTSTDEAEKTVLLSSELAAKRQSVEKLTGELAVLKDLLEKNGKDQITLNEQLESKKEVVYALQVELQDQNKQSMELREKIDGLGLDLSAALANVETKTEECTAYQERVSALSEIAATQEGTLESQSEQIATLEHELTQSKAMVNHKSSTIDQLRVEMRETNAALESDVSAAQGKHSDLERALVAVKAEMHQHHLENQRKDVSLASIQAEIETVRFKSEKEIKSLNNKLSEREDSLSRKDEELRLLKDALEKGTATLHEELKSQTSKVCSLTKSLASVEHSLEEEQQRYGTDITEREQTIASLRIDLHALQDKMSSSQAENDSTTSDLKHQLETLQRESQERRARVDSELALLEKEMQKKEMELAIANDEIRDLKMIDLKEMEEQAESLESELAQLRLKARGDETASAALVSDLRATVDQLESRLSSAERGKDDTKYHLDRTVSKLHTELESMKSENESLNLELKDNFSKLQDRHSTITKLTSEKAKLEETESRLCAEIESLMSDAKKAKEEQEKTTLALEREMDKHRASLQDEDIEFQKRKASLQKQLHDSLNTIECQTKQISGLQQELEGRTTLLADMVAHNKESEDQEKRLSSEVSDMQQMADNFKTDLESAQKELARFKSSYGKKEDQLLTTLSTEREMREVAEAELEDVQAQLKVLKRDGKEVTDLEKENSELRDKVKRQEAYLKRKLQKDKSMRERTTGISKPTPATATPMKRGRLTPSNQSNVK